MVEGLWTVEMVIRRMRKKDNGRTKKVTFKFSNPSHQPYPEDT